MNVKRQGKIACVLSSGGMRGAYQLGVLKAMHEKGMVFDLMVGASAGACNAARYVAEQIDVCIHIWLDHCSNRRAINPYRVLVPWSRRPAMDLDYSFHDAVVGHELDVERIAASPTEVLVAVTAFPQMKTEYKPPTVEQLIPLLKASCAVPYFYNRPIYLDGQRYLDGGLINPIPLEPAIESDCDTVYVLAVRCEEEVEAAARPGFLTRRLYRFMTPVQRACVDRSAERARIHRALSEGCHDRTDKTIVLFRPHEPLPTGRFTIDSSRIQESVDIGYQHGLDML